MWLWGRQSCRPPSRGTTIGEGQDFPYQTCCVISLVTGSNRQHGGLENGNLQLAVRSYLPLFSALVQRRLFKAMTSAPGLQSQREVQQHGPWRHWTFAPRWWHACRPRNGNASKLHCTSQLLEPWNAWTWRYETWSRVSKRLRINQIQSNKGTKSRSKKGRRKRGGEHQEFVHCKVQTVETVSGSSSQLLQCEVLVKCVTCPSVLTAYIDKNLCTASFRKFDFLPWCQVAGSSQYISRSALAQRDHSRLSEIIPSLSFRDVVGAKSLRIARVIHFSSKTPFGVSIAACGGECGPRREDRRRGPSDATVSLAVVTQQFGRHGQSCESRFCGECNC